MNPISLNTVTCAPQPNNVNENPEQIQSDQFAIDGSMQRDNMGKKARAVLTWTYLTFAQYQAFVVAFEAGTVHYKNLLSSVHPSGVLEFDGLATYEASDYVNSASPLLPLTVTIRQV